ncbi:Spo0J Stage 0 sporulation protein J (antagonist of Soj) containing ParB-like nuclease domain [uncultured Caudovirales phage]|uniref:Spo0J Stage 0 sporulation protein J (Antagonist of Soj) containing ParB-like nuclease domain n=1 Tax=uncultured Caudovirales phage TaxID=2100421 RepID=A0A6J5SW28_9CAUD|nr:Spo0J Stage 0 sporulation protein J (antagonist of Soj) containing ParB-like nuclease domain [uncultured Caudovirales phage]CAB4219713.1 Spo0J Stage 0 sporulation protein J (antagonist of Soj) containing ParB-like nuclease domain [uncultured Caudovirales phage]
MICKTVPVNSISQDPANLRKHGERNIDAIVASLRKFGQQHPIVIDSKGIILSGNGRYMAAVKLGWHEIQVVESDLTGSSATAYAIADNRTAELADWDTTALAETLRALQSEEFDTDAAGYSESEIDALVEGLNIGSQTVEPEQDKQPTNLIPGYEDRNIKQIILLYETEQYELIVDALWAYCDTHAMASNSEAIAHMIEHNGYSTTTRL